MGNKGNKKNLFFQKFVIFFIKNFDFFNHILSRNVTKKVIEI